MIEGMKLDRERQQVFFAGQVQGVGFRYTARRVARHHAVSGFVRNLPDGRVELVVEGDSAEIDRFLGELRNTMAAYIQHCDVHRIPASGEFDEFEIRF
jgi:acylphosphatase